jgi:hypothetical protein
MVQVAVMEEPQAHPDSRQCSVAILPVEVAVQVHHCSWAPRVTAQPVAQPVVQRAVVAMRAGYRSSVAPPVAGQLVVQRAELQVAPLVVVAVWVGCHTSVIQPVHDQEVHLGVAVDLPPRLGPRRDRSVHSAAMATVHG